MSDTEESSSSEDSEGSSTSCSSVGLLQACSEEAMPANQDPEPSASSSQPAPRRKGTRHSARLAGRPEHPSNTEARGGPSAESFAASRGQTKLPKPKLDLKANTEARGGPSAESSAASRGQTKLPKPKLDLKALFDYHSRRRELRRRRRRRPRSPQAEAAAKSYSPEPRAKRPRLVAAKGGQKKRLRERCLQFPFVRKVYGKKLIPLRMECLFEQGVLEGFFKYIEMLKFEHHLNKSLAQLDATDDLERESLESRRHKYLDDDGPLSPIEETSGEDMNEDCDTEDIGARIVENSHFVLSSEIPKKKKSKRKTKA